MLWRALLHMLSFAALIGCAAGPSLGTCQEPDGGALDGGCQRDDVSDPVEAPEDDVDAGPEAVSDFDAAVCRTLVDDVCGAGDPPACADASACAAAKLLQRYETSACAAALDNDVTYPACRPGPCSLLVDRVCGGQTSDAACSEAPGCEPARVLLERASSADASERAEAEASCNAALEDDVVFALCQSGP